MLKKLSVLFVSLLLMVCVFAGCTDNNNNPPSNEGGGTVDVGGNENENGSGGMVNPDSSILIAYFSWSGHTEQLAEVIHIQVGGDMFVITPKVPYTTDINKLSGQASQELRDNVRPELATHVDDFDKYDVIFVGYPNWWSNAPMPVFTFLEEYDFTGKTVVPFSVYGSSVWGNSISSIKSTLPTATILDGYCVQEHAMQNVNSDVNFWLKKIGITL